MDKLSVMFDVKQFAAAFGAARDDSSFARSEPDVMMWLEGGVGSAGAGFAWGHGQLSFQGHDHPFRVFEFIHRGCRGGGHSCYRAGHAAEEDHGLQRQLSGVKRGSDDSGGQFGHLSPE
jgi:hypothetical protein